MQFPANVAQNWLGQTAGGISKERQGRQPVKICYRDEIGFFQFLHRIKAAAPAECIIDAVCQHIAEFHSDVIFIQFFQEGSFGFVSQPFHCIFQVFLCHLTGNRHQGQRQGVCRFIQTIGVCQVGKNRVMIYSLHFPQIRFPRSFDRVGIRNIKNIAQPKPGPRIVQQRNAFRAAIHPTVHLAVPQFQLCAGNCIGPLGVDQKIILKRIAV